MHEMYRELLPFFTDLERHYTRHCFISQRRIITKIYPFEDSYFFFFSEEIWAKTLECHKILYF